MAKNGAEKKYRDFYKLSKATGGEANRSVKFDKSINMLMQKTVCSGYGNNRISIIMWGNEKLARRLRVYTWYVPIAWLKKLNFCPNE